MEHIGYIIMTGLLISLASISGVALVKSHKKVASFVERNLEILGALSGGIFLYTSITIGHEAVEGLGTQQALFAFAVGALLFMFMQKIHTSHRHIGHAESHDHSHDRKSALKILIGDTIHNIADGLLLVASFGTSVSTGITTSLSIAIHEIPQEISEFIVLKKSGYTNLEAAYKNFATALSIFIGIAIGFLFYETSSLQGYLLGTSASFFLGIIFTDLFPLARLLKPKKYTKIILAFILGVSLMFGVAQFTTDHDHQAIEQH